jgi:2-polyprenyl-3-methyl-5-hydroxy-6-metoxy-1,4-benzoquinol methylase
VACYRLILGREPESQAAVDSHIAHPVGAADLVQRFLGSPEAIDRFSRSIPRYHNHIEIDGSPRQLAALESHIEQVWRALGSEDPYWSVLTHERFRMTAMTPEAEDEFYKSGEGDVHRMFFECERAQIHLRRSGTVLDFGCGTGRLGEHLSRLFAHYVGVDISSSHLALAKGRLSSSDRGTVEFQLLPDFLQRDQKFDVIISLIVLQHNPPPTIVRMLKKLIDSLSDGGVAYIQIPAGYPNYSFQLSRYLSNISRKEGGMEMHAVPQHIVLDLAQNAGCRIIAVYPDGFPGGLAESYTYIFRRLMATDGLTRDSSESVADDVSRTSDPAP